MDKKPLAEQLFIRSVPMVPASIDETSKSIDFTLATDAAVMVYHPDYGYIREILSMEAPEVPEQVPMLDTHSRWSTADQLGAFRNPSIERNEGGISALKMTAYFGDSQRAFDAWRLYGKGLSDACSASYQYLDYAEYVPEGTKVKINGREEIGQLLIVHRWKLLEGSLCPIGADSQSKARSLTPTQTMSKTGSALDAAPEPTRNLEEIKTMEKDTTIPAVTDVKALEAARAEGARAEAERRTAIEDVCTLANFPADKARELSNDATMTQARAIETVKAWLKTQSVPVPQARTSDIEIGANRSLENIRSAAPQGLAMGWDSKVTIAKPADNAEAFRNGGTERVLRELLRAHNVDSSVMSRKEVIESAFARGYVMDDFANITKDAASLKLAADVAVADTVYQNVVEIGNAEDFKRQYRARLMDAGSLKEVTESGEYETIKLSDEGSYIQLVEHGGTIAITRKVLINDSLGALVNAAGRVANRAQLDIEAAVFGLLINNKLFDGNQIFTSGHKNIGTTGALTTTSLDEARMLLAAIKGEQGQAMGLKGKMILTGAKYARVAAEICTSTSASDANHAAVANYYKGLQAFETSAITDGAWFLLGNFGTEPHLEVAFMNGSRVPTVTTKEKAGTSGIILDINMDYGVAAHSWRNMIKNAGA